MTERKNALPMPIKKKPMPLDNLSFFLFFCDRTGEKNRVTVIASLLIFKLPIGVGQVFDQDCPIVGKLVGESIASGSP